MFTTKAIKGLICDLDGTLIDSRLDFGAMRREIGVPSGSGILEYIESIASEPQRAEAENILHRFEREGGEAATLFPGVSDFLQKLRSRSIPLAILTRNSGATAAITMARLGIHVDMLVAREHAPPKPHPGGVEKILKAWQISPEETFFVGDFLYDIEAGRRAGVPTVLYAPEEIPEFAPLADFIVRSFSELDSLVFSRR